MDKGSKVTQVEGKRHQVMVCGATGFIGSHVVAQLLKSGYTNVHIISRTLGSCTNLEKILNHYGVGDRYDDINIHYGEITNYGWLQEAFTECHTVFNCASTVDMNSSDGAQLIIDNTTLTYLIAEASVAAKVSKIVHVSSIAVLKAEDFPNVTTETCFLETLKGQSPYAVSKFYSENEIWRIAENGVQTVIVNPAVVLGYGDINGSSSQQIIKKIRSGMPFYTSGMTGYVMVEDVACAMVALSVSESAVGERFILCNDSLSYQDMIRSVASSLGVRGGYIKIPDWLVLGFGYLCNVLGKVGIKGKFTLSFARTLTSKYIYDGSKVCTMCDFKYSDIREAIKIMGGDYKSI